MSENALSVELREGTGKGRARRLRAEGRIPAVLYGLGKEAVSLSLNPRELEEVLHASEAGMNTLIDLSGGVSGKTVLVKELQREPVRGGVLHADLVEVALDQTVHVSVPIHIEGTAVGVSLGGGLMDHSLRELELECLPRSIPDEVTVDVSALELGDSLHVRDIALPEGVVLLTDGDLSVVSVVAPAAEEEAPVADEEAAAEGAEAAPASEGDGEAGGSTDS